MKNLEITDSLVYDPSPFCEVGSLEEAKYIVLTPYGGISSEQRWKEETALTVPLLKDLRKEAAFNEVLTSASNCQNLLKEQRP